jgi:hypothetical protein
LLSFAYPDGPSICSYDPFTYSCIAISWVLVLTISFSGPLLLVAVDLGFLFLATI